MSRAISNLNSTPERNQEGVKRMKIAQQGEAMVFPFGMPTVIALFLIATMSLTFGATRLAAQLPAQDTLQKQASGQARFATPEEAMRALVNAAKTKDRGALADIFGAEHQAEMFSGDQVQDNEEMDEFAADVQESAKLEKVNDTQFTLFIGVENWPFPMPLVKEDNQWRFDSEKGEVELLNRRIGQNELSTILTCRAYVLAQREYFDQQNENAEQKEMAAEYARRFLSSPGRRDGLYWDTAEGEKPSPLGILVASARAEGYGANGAGNDPKGFDAQNGNLMNVQQADGTPVSNTQDVPMRSRNPYHGYYFKILTRQGPQAPGGRSDYVVDGRMVAGFALIAFPDRWSSSGVMTFIVSQQGDVYEKNLGPETASIADAIDEYNPDPTWTLVQE
ncbi:MAG: DUF2950 domain-containing protein [Candidatus Acidiferrum sp.]